MIWNRDGSPATLTPVRFTDTEGRSATWEQLVEQNAQWWEADEQREETQVICRAWVVNDNVRGGWLCTRRVVAGTYGCARHQSNLAFSERPKR